MHRLIRARCGRSLQWKSILRQNLHLSCQAAAGNVGTGLQSQRLFPSLNSLASQNTPIVQTLMHSVLPQPLVLQEPLPRPIRNTGTGTIGEPIVAGICAENMKNHSCAIVTHGNHTDIVIEIYSNRILLIVTHFKKFGSLIAVTRESVLDQFNSDIFSTKVLFGKDDIEIATAARYIAEHINIDKPLLLSISLKEYDPGTVKAIVAAVNKIRPW